MEYSTPGGVSSVLSDKGARGISSAPRAARASLQSSQGPPRRPRVRRPLRPPGFPVLAGMDGSTCPNSAIHQEASPVPRPHQAAHSSSVALIAAVPRLRAAPGTQRIRVESILLRSAVSLTRVGASACARRPSRGKVRAFSRCCGVPFCAALCETPLPSSFPAAPRSGSPAPLKRWISRNPVSYWP